MTLLTLLLTRADVSRHTHALQLLGDLRQALTARVAPDPVQPLRFASPMPSGSTLVRHASLPSIPAYSVTVQAEERAGEPSSRAVLQLHDGSTGRLLALMDAGQLLTLRACLVSALAAEALSRPTAERVAIIGEGPLASGSLKALRLVRSLREVFLFGEDLAVSTEAAMRLQSSLSTPVRAPAALGEAEATADLIVLTGGTPLPEVPLKPGCHLTVLGAERLRSCPVPRGWLDRALRVREHASPALSWAPDFHAELGEVLGQTHPGRTSPEQDTFFASVGPAYLDLIAAWHVYQGAKHDESLTRLELER